MYRHIQIHVCIELEKATNNTPQQQKTTTTTDSFVKWILAVAFRNCQLPQNSLEPPPPPPPSPIETAYPSSCLRLTLGKSRRRRVDPDKCCRMRQFIWAFPACQSICLSLSVIQCVMINEAYMYNLFIQQDTGPQIRVCDWKLFFLFLNQNICCWYSKEPSRWEGSLEHPKHMFNLMDKIIIAILRKLFLLNWPYQDKS